MFRMSLSFSRAVTRAAIAAALVAMGGASGQTVSAPSVPPNLVVPEGHSAFLKALATGTQNYVCLPSSSGMAWKFQGPQATLFITYRWMNGEVRQQIATHYLSVNPMETGTARPAWQHSWDTSAVWAKKLEESTDSNYVAPGAIPWLLLQAVGTQEGPTDGSALAQTTYIQRINTAGGIAPATACSEAGQIAFVPYTTDYVFYRQSRK